MKHVPAERTNVLNPIRHVLEREMKPNPNHEKKMINLGLGEPKKEDGYVIPQAINDAIIEQVNSGSCNGYTQACGTIEARKAVASKFGTTENPIDPNNVFLTFGTSGALYNAIAVLCERGDEVLVGRPGFPLYQPICENLGVTWGHYDLIPEKNWEVDLESMRAAIKPNTKAILVNNPSNPCGSCFTKDHMLEILKIADEHRIPMICDEVYYGLSYDEARPFISFSELSKTVPMICTGSLSKIYCIPGWRCGWTIVYNNSNYFDKVIDNLGKHSMILLHPCSLVQSALPKIFSEVGEDHFTSLKLKLKTASDAGFERLSKINGVNPIRSSAAMYMMVGIDPT
jgi:tyrosine aminotransferase